MVGDDGVGEQIKRFALAHLTHDVEKEIDAGSIGKDAATAFGDSHDEIDGVGYVVAAKVGHVSLSDPVGQACPERSLP